jgi:two-component system nitrogen regulation response regulator GlnG
MPAELQTRLLRVLAEGEFYRVGGHLPVRTDVRVIAATHQNLEDRVRMGTFREDLFHRLNVIRVQIPSLSERREDVPLLMKYFLNRAAEELQVEVKNISPEAERMLVGLDWPGNVRQLENLCRWLTVMASGREVLVEDLPKELQTRSEQSNSRGPDWETALRSWADQRLAQGGSALLDTALPSFEKVMIRAALEKTGGRRQDAARLLGWGRNTLTRKIRELAMD